MGIYNLRFSALPFLAGRSPNTKDTKPALSLPKRTQRGKKSLDFKEFSFVTFVSFVVEKKIPVKNGRT